MKKVFALCIGMLLFTGCEQDIISPEIEEINIDQNTFMKKGNKVDVCHKGKIINISINAVSAHQAHGDAVDMDGDGYFDIENECMNYVDCDDSNAAIYPGAEEICDDELDNDCDGLTDCEDSDCPPCQALPTVNLVGFEYNIYPILNIDYDYTWRPVNRWQEAFEYCENLEAFGYDDWFLPARYEYLMLSEAIQDPTVDLNNMLINMGARPFFEGDRLWTSSQQSAIFYYVAVFDSGGGMFWIREIIDDPNNACRCIRADERNPQWVL